MKNLMLFLGCEKSELPNLFQEYYDYKVLKDKVFVGDFDLVKIQNLMKGNYSRIIIKLNYQFQSTMKYLAAACTLAQLEKYSVSITLYEPYENAPAIDIEEYRFLAGKLTTVEGKKKLYPSYHPKTNRNIINVTRQR